jgi:hypothetical protein
MRPLPLVACLASAFVAAQILGACTALPELRFSDAGGSDVDGSTATTAGGTTAGTTAGEVDAAPEVDSGFPIPFECPGGQPTTLFTEEYRCCGATVCQGDCKGNFCNAECLGRCKDTEFCCEVRGDVECIEYTLRGIGICTDKRHR